MISYKLVSHCNTSRKNNKQIISTFKFSCPRLTLKEGSKVKSDHMKRFPTHDFLQVGFTLQTSRTYNKGDIGTFKSSPCGVLWSFKIKCLQGCTGHISVIHITYEEIQPSTYEIRPAERGRSFSTKCLQRQSCFSE